jgi:GTP cyclohydrolase III
MLIAAVMMPKAAMQCAYLACNQHSSAADDDRRPDKPHSWRAMLISSDDISITHRTIVIVSLTMTIAGVQCLLQQLQ